MSYIGQQPTVGNFQICDAISVVNGQAAYTMQVGGVNVIPETSTHMIVSLNGVIQKSGGANPSFTVSGSTITFASNLVTGDVINFIQILGSVLNVGTVSDSTITDAKANFVSTSSAAGLQIKGDGTTDGTLQLNCSQNSHGIKLKSPPHSASASYTLTFPNNDGSSGETLTTNGSGVLSWASAGGITEADSWRLTTDLAMSQGTQAVISANWERNDTSGFNKIGTGMTESSGIFTFASTGIYLVTMTWFMTCNSDAEYGGGRIDKTTDNSSYAEMAECYGNWNAGGGYSTVRCSIFFDVTNTSTHKVRFTQIKHQNTMVLKGNTSANFTSAQFIKLADT